MATSNNVTLEDRNLGRTSVSVPRPAYSGVATAAAAGGSRHAGSNAGRYSVSISQWTIGDQYAVASRYLKPKTFSCHDSCKHGMKPDEATPIIHKKSVVKRKKVTKTVIPVVGETTMQKKPKSSRHPKIHARNERFEAIGQENMLPSKKVGNCNSSTNRKPTHDELKLPKSVRTNVKPKQMVVSTGRKTEKDVKSGNLGKRVSKTNELGSLSSKVSKYRNHELVSPLKDQNRMTKTRLKELIAKKVLEKTLHELKPESEAKDDASEFIQIPTNLTTESTIPPELESSADKQSSCDKEEECEYANDEDGFVPEDDNDMETSEWNHDKIRRNRGVIPEDEDDEAFRLKFRRGKVLELESDDGAKRLKFRSGRVLEDNSNHESESVTLKHQEVQEKKEAQELLNNIIEETASKLVDDMKTKVEALVGAFETVISLQDDTPSSE